MQATVIPFPPLMRLRSADAAGVPERTAAAVAPSTNGAPDPGLAANLLLAVPLLLSPGAADARAVLALLLAALAFGLAGIAGPGLPGLVRRPLALLTLPGAKAVGTVLFALGAAAAVGPGLAAALLLFVAVETCRHTLAAVPRRPGIVDTGLLAAGLLLRFDAAFVALGLEPAPELLAAGRLLAPFLALASPRETAGRGRGAGGLWTDLVLLALAAGVAGLYAAALLGDPRIAGVAGVWPLATVPLVVAGLARLWRFRHARQTGSPRGADRWLVGIGAAWAGLLLLLLG